MRNFNNTVFIGKVWQHFDNLPSTNEFLSNSRENAKITEGVVVSTFNQTDGRGQMGNRWLSEAYQNIAVSILLQPSFLHISEQFHLNKAMALAVHDFIVDEIRIEDKNNKYDFVPTHVQTTHQVNVKWANDVLINDKKVAGILIQNTVSNNTLQSCIIGIGVNINQLHFDKNLNATSLTLETGRSYDLFTLLERLAQCVEKRYLQLKSYDFTALHAEYLSKLYRFETEHLFKYTDTNTPFYGKIMNVSPIGKLEILTNKGIEAFDIKEIKFVFE